MSGDKRAVHGENRIRAAFEHARAQGRGALVTYLMGGDPGPGRDMEYIRAAAEGGADVVEVGIPFSDPIADGPTIQRAAVRALRAGTRPRDVLASVRALREEGFSAPVVVMTYANIAYAMGYEGFADALFESGVDGAIIADMPVEESGALRDALAARSLALVLLAAPLTRGDRLRRIAKETGGFLYVVASFGTTGARDELAGETLGVLEAVRPVANEAGVPLAVGFGLSRAEQVRTLVKNGAQGVVVGSALVQLVEEGVGPDRLTAAVRELASGLTPERAPSVEG